MGAFRDGKAVSAVVATIIIVAVAIAVAIAVALWSTGIIQGFFKVEKLQLIPWADVAEPPDTFKVTIEIRNVGTRDSVINGIFLNNKPFWEANVSRVSFYIEGVNETLPLAFSLPIGKTARIEVYLGLEYYHGQFVEVKLRTAAGNEVIQTANLP